MKNRTEYKNYGKGVLIFGKHKGKTIKEIISNEDYEIQISKVRTESRITNISILCAGKNINK